MKQKQPGSPVPCASADELAVVPGYRAAGLSAGIKKDGKKDLALVTSDPPARAAGLFTRNRVQAAPVLLDRERIRSGLCGALLVNSGNANACTGEAGLRDAFAVSRDLARALGMAEQHILLASTGVIGVRLPVSRIRKALPRLVTGLRSQGLDDAAEAIRTTDRFAKRLWRQASIRGRTVTLFGMAKGAGMICPNLATMLAFFLTDLNAPVTALRRMLRAGTEESFNRINVDGDASTNDTVLLLANGRAGNEPARPGTVFYEVFYEDLLLPMMRELSRMIVRDGEGATKAVEIRVQGARSARDARTLAYKLANSSLVKTSFYGEDINWGRFMAALGCAGPVVRPDLVDIWYDSVQVVRRGVLAGKSREARARQVLRKDAFSVTVDLHLGNGSYWVVTSDLTHDYVSLNASYRS